MPEEIELRAPPTRRRSGRFIMCRNIQRGCLYYPGCRFGHSEEEMQVWSWMAAHQGN